MGLLSSVAQECAFADVIKEIQDLRAECATKPEITADEALEKLEKKISGFKAAAASGWY